MTITTSVLENTGVLEIVYSPDPVTLVDLAEQRELVADAISRNNTAKVLIDASALTHFPNPFVVLKHNEGVVENDVLRKAKYAVVCSELGDDERCLEDTGVNRGVLIRCFTSRKDALCWLD